LEAASEMVVVVADVDVDGSESEVVAGGGVCRSSLAAGFCSGSGDAIFLVSLASASVEGFVLLFLAGGIVICLMRYSVIVMFGQWKFRCWRVAVATVGSGAPN